MGKIFFSVFSILWESRNNEHRNYLIPFIKPDSSEKLLLTVGKVVTLVVGMGSFVFALAVPNIIDALTTAYTLWAPTIVIPLIIAVIWKVHNKVAGLSGITAGGIVTVIWVWWLHEPLGLSGLVAGILANIIAFLLAYVLTGKKQELLTQQDLTRRDIQ